MMFGVMADRMTAVEKLATAAAPPPVAPSAQARASASRTVESDGDITSPDVDRLRVKRNKGRRVRIQEESEESEEDYTPRPKKTKGKKNHKSGRYWVEDGDVVHTTPWPNQEVCDLATGRHPSPDDLTIAQFCFGFLTLNEKAEESLRPHRQAVLLEVLQDAQQYRWEVVRGAHFAFLDRIEQDTTTWDNLAVRNEMRRMLIWTQPREAPVAAVTAPAWAASASAPTARKPGPAKGKPHCSYCFTKIQRKFPHTVAECRTKKADARAGN